MTLASIDQDQYRYLKTRNLDCGIITKAKRKGESSRIMNGNPSIHTYPWMVQVILKLYRDKTFIGANVGNFKYSLFVNAGAFISDKAIITCGHCICNGEDPTTEDPYLITCGAENPSGGNDMNLNQKGSNEVEISFGKRTRAKNNDFTFNIYIKAYVYKYGKVQAPTQEEETAKIQRRKGDIGIIVTHSRIGLKFDLKKGKVLPICLPAPDTFTKKSPIDVKLVGWGLRLSFERSPTGVVVKHSCCTNGGREFSSQLYPATGGISIVPCEVNRLWTKACNGGIMDYNGFDRRQIRTFSSKTKILLNILSDNLVDYIKDDPGHKKCVDYMDKAVVKWINKKKRLDTYQSKKGIGVNLKHKLSRFYLKKKRNRSLIYSLSCNYNRSKAKVL